MSSGSPDPELCPCGVAFLTQLDPLGPWMWTPHDARLHQGGPREQCLGVRGPSSSSLSLS